MEPPKRRAAPPSMLLKREEQPSAIQQEEAPKGKDPVPSKGSPRPAGAEPQAPKPAVPAGEYDGTGLGFTDSGADEAEGQLTLYALQKLDLPERYVLWKQLNRGSAQEAFVTVLRPDALPKTLVRELPPAKTGAPAMKGVRNVLWCCYCGDWSVFELFAYIGSTKCICCSMSTKDFFNRTANKLWSVEL